MLDTHVWKESVETSDRRRPRPRLELAAAGADFEMGGKEQREAARIPRPLESPPRAGKAGLVRILEEGVDPATSGGGTMSAGLEIGAETEASSGLVPFTRWAWAAALAAADRSPSSSLRPLTVAENKTENSETIVVNYEIKNCNSTCWLHMQSEKKREQDYAEVIIKI